MQCNPCHPDFRPDFIVTLETVDDDAECYLSAVEGLIEEDYVMDKRAQTILLAHTQVLLLAGALVHREQPSSRAILPDRHQERVLRPAEPPGCGGAGKGVPTGP